jgi:tRNA nucleotidyltransferase (CCA-adding enzyme)
VRRLFRRTIPVGIEFGTVGVLDQTGRMHEVTTFRRDVKTDGRHAVVEFGASLDEDLARRDFTINAIAYDPLAKRLHDPFAGQADLAAGVVRAVGQAADRMREDRLRALRAIRFASRFDFVIEPATWAAIAESAPYLGRLSPERVKQELDKTMEQVRRPSVALARWRDSGAFRTLVPVLADVSDVVLARIDALPKPGLPAKPVRRALRMAALFSHVDGKAAETALRALRASNQEIAVVGSLVDRWHRHCDALRALALNVRAQRSMAADDAALRTVVADVGRLRIQGLLRLAAACWSGDASIPPLTVRTLYRRATRIAWRDPIEVADLAVDGDDLRTLGVPRGPAMGDILQQLLALVIARPEANTHVELSAYVTAWVASRQTAP